MGPKILETGNLITCVVRLGLEPRLFWTKTRRVAYYTTGHSDLLVTKLDLFFEIRNKYLGNMHGFDNWILCAI